MHQGNWKCSGCGGKITELPFQPRSETGLTCRACWSKNNGRESEPMPDTTTAGEMPNDIPEEAGLAGEPMSDDDFGMETTPAKPKENGKFQGEWKCAGCSGAITSLPFKPRDTSNLKCLDCFKKSRG